MTPSTIPVEEIVLSTGSLGKAPRDSLELSYLKKVFQKTGRLGLNDQKAVISDVGQEERIPSSGLEYAKATLLKFSVEHRTLLALVGVACIGMGVAFSYGVCSALGFLYTPPHKVLPFLFLGFGIDDMFVIVQCWNNMTPEERKNSSHSERFAHTMKRAGVAITITSVTDMVAFGIGSLTQVSKYPVCYLVNFAIYYLVFFQISGASTQIFLHVCLCWNICHFHVPSNRFSSCHVSGSKGK